MRISRPAAAFALVPLFLLAVAGRVEGEGIAPLTLDRCVDLALAAAPRLEASGAETEEARARANEASARRFPALDMGGSYLFTSEVMEKVIDPGFGIDPIEFDFGDGHQADLNLGITVPLYTGGELSKTVRAERAGARAAERMGEAVRLDLIRETRAAFYAALGRRAGAEAAAVAVGRLERRVKYLEEALRLGAATEEDRLRAEARLGDARVRLASAEASRDSAAYALGRLIGRPGESAEPDGDLERSLLPGRDTSAALIAERPELEALEESRRRMETLAGAVGGRFLPRVTGDLRAHYGRPGVDLLENEWMEYATASLSLHWTLWDFGGRSAARKRAEAGARRAAAERREREEALVAAHRTAETALRAAGTELAEAERKAELSREILELVRRRRAEAHATESEYLDAEDDRAAAEIGLALARVRVRLAETTLLWTVGQ